MAENSSVKNNDHPTKKRGVVSKTLDLIMRILGLLIFSAIISILIEWIGITFFYPEEGFSHAKSMMETEIRYLGGSAEVDDINSEAINTASERVSRVVNFLFIDSGVIEYVTSLKAIDHGDGKISRLFKGLMAEYYDYLMSAIFIMVVFIIRLAILILSIPAFMLFGAVGLCDGLMQRDMRRWCGGNESGFIYHWAKKFSGPVLMLAWIVYLAIPNSVHPNFVITPFAVLFGLVIMVMSSKFKKYL